MEFRLVRTCGVKRSAAFNLVSWFCKEWEIQGLPMRLYAILALGLYLLLFSFDSQAQTTDICSRTSQIRAVILQQLELESSDCGSVPTDDLARIKEIDASRRGVSSLKVGDFLGLSGLETLSLRSNDLTVLPEDLFSGLSILNTLDLAHNDLTDLPGELFDGPSDLETLDLSYNDLTSLQEDLFEGLSSLEIMYLNNNELTSLLEDLFDGLSSLETLWVSNNDLTGLPEDLFDGLSSLETLYLSRNDLTSLLEDLFSELSSLETLYLSHNDLTSLPEDLFSGLSSLKTLGLDYNDLTDLPGDLFDGLFSLEDLYLYDNKLTSLPEDLFDGLSSLELLGMSGNNLTSLQEDLFEGLSSLEELELSETGLTSLPEDIFSGLSSLGALYLIDNNLTSLPEDLFDGLSSLEIVYLYNNDLTTLPEGLFDHKNSSPPILYVSLEENPIECLPSTILDNPHVYIIYDEDIEACTAAKVTIELSSSSINENGGNTTVTAKLDRELSAEATVVISATPQSGATNSDYELSTNTALTIGAGETTSTGTVTITAVDNDRDEPDKKIKVSGTATSTETVTGPDDVTLTIEDDEITPTVTLELSSSSINENGGSTTVTAKLDHALSAEATVLISATPQSGATNSNYELSTNTTLTIGAAETTSTGTVTITAVDNDRDEPDKTILVSGTATSTETVTGPDDVTLTIEDDEDAPTVTLELSSTSILENGGSTIVTAALDRPSSAETTVTVSATHMSPVMTSDYALSDNTMLTIAAGATTSTGEVSITAVDNDVDTPDKTVTIQGVAMNAQGITDPTGVTLTITDDDNAPMVTLVLSSASISENGGSTTVTATLDRPSGAVTRVRVSADPQPPATSADYVVSPNAIIIIAAGKTESTGEVTITAVDNDVDTPNKTVTIQGVATNAQGITSPANVTLTITDDDVAAVTAPLSVAVTEGSSSDLSVALSSQPTGAVTVMITGHAGTDLIPNPPELTFSDTNWNSPQSVTLTAAEDGDITNDQVTLALTASGGGYTGVTHSVAVTITDNDVAAITAPVSVVVPEGGSGNLQVSLSAAPTGNVTLTITGHASTDLTPTPPMLIFTTTSRSVTQTVQLTAAEDDDAVNDQFTLMLMASGGGYSGVTHSVAVTITDNDVAAIAAPASVVVPEGGSRDLSVSLSSQPTGAVTVMVTGHAGTDLIPNPPELTFSNTNWNTPQSVTLTAAEDGDITDDEVTLALAASGGGYTGVTHSVSVTITDNDMASITAPVSVVVPEGGSRDLSVALSSQPTGAVTVMVTGHAGTDLIPNPPELTFSNTNWNTPQSVTLTAAEDGDITDDEVTLALAASGGGYTGVAHSVSVTITDNDMASITAPVSVVVPEGSSSDLSVALSSQPTGAVTVMVTGHAGTDLIPNPPELTFLDTNWNTPQSVTLTAAEDGDITDDEVTLALTASGGGYTGVTHSVAVTITDNDVAAITAPVSAVVPEGGSRDLSVALSSQPTGAVTVMVTGHAGTDLIPNPPELTFSNTNWNTPQSVTLTAAEDGDITDDQVTLALTASGGGYTGVTHSVAVTITDNDVAAITAPASVVVPEGGSADLSVALSSQPTGAITVMVTGHAGTDLIPNPPELTFSDTNWNTPQSVTLTAAEDGDITDDEVTLALTASGGGYTGVTHSVAVTITDNDVAAITAPASVVVPEGGSSDLSVALSSQPTGAVTVMVTGHAGTDLIPNPPELTFSDTNWNTQQSMTLTAAEDGDVTNDQVTLTLTASGNGYTGVTQTVVVTITDNDVAAVKAPVSVVIPEGGSADLSVALSSQPTGPVTLMVTGHAGTDLTPNPPELTFSNTNWNTPQSVTLTAAEDGDITDDEVTLALAASGGGYTGVTHSVAVTITDNDVAAITAPVSVVVPEGGSSDLSVALSSQPTGAVTVMVTGHVGTDLIPNPPELTFSDTNWNTPQSVTLTAAEDEDFMNDPVALTLAASGGGYADVTHSVALTITDNDVAAVKAPVSVVIPEGGSSNLPIALLAQPTEEVTLTIIGYAGTDLTPTPPVLTFTATDWAIAQTVTLTAAEDDDFVNDPVVLTLMASGGGYVGVMHSAAVTITDNDVAAVTAPTSTVIPEGSSSNLPIALSAQPTADVTLTMAGYAGTDLTPKPTVLTFTTTNWNVTKTLTLTAAEDEDFTNDHVALTLTASGGGYVGVMHSVAVTITDNDQEPVSISIYDLQVMEDEQTGQLRVELNRPSEEVVTVQFATSDKTAERESDYSASRGIMIFERHATMGVIPVGIVDDDIPESEEQLVVTLSKPRNAVIDRGVGTLTIVDNDGGVTLRIEDEVVKAVEGIVRFTVRLSGPSLHPVSVAYRTEDGTARAGEDYRASSGVVEFAPGAVAATIAVPLLRKGQDWRHFSVHLERSTHARIARAVAVATIRESDSVARDMLRAYAARFVRTSSVQIVEALQERVRSGADASACSAGDRANLVRLWQLVTGWRPSLGELLGGCHIRRGMVVPGGAIRVWGRGAFRRFNGQGEGALSLRGEVVTGLVGMDYEWNGRWMAGLVVSHNRGEGTFAVHEDAGELESRLTGVYPFVAYKSQNGGIWGTGGYGRGQAEALELEGDLGSGFGALGFWGRLSSGHPVQFIYYGDGIYADAVVKRQDVDVDVYRLRLGLEADVQIREEVRPYVKASVRQDGGSAETGLGLELGAGVRMEVPAWRLKGDVQTQRLVMHTAKGFTEWGVSGSVQFGSGTEGLMLRVRPSWGPSLGRTLFHQQTVLDAAPVGRSLNRTEMELGYGIAVWQGLARPMLGTTWQSGGALIRLGGELHPRDRFTVSVSGLVHAHAATRGAIGLNLRGSLQY